jgi:hypothetical protein
VTKYLDGGATSTLKKQAVRELGIFSKKTYYLKNNLNVNRENLLETTTNMPKINYSSLEIDNGKINFIELLVSLTYYACGKMADEIC